MSISEKQQKSRELTSPDLLVAKPTLRNTKSDPIKASLRAFLSDPGSLPVRFAEPVESMYNKRHLSLTLDLQRSNWPWVLLTVLSFCLIGSFMAGESKDVVYPMNGVIFVAVMIPILVLWSERLSRFIFLANGMAAAITLITFQLAAAALPVTARQKSVAEYAVIFVMIALFTIARLPVRQAIGWSLSAMIVAPASILLLDSLTMNWDRFIYYAGGSLIVSWLLGHIQDSRERTVFAQEYLLEQEKEQLETLSEELALASRIDKLTDLPNRRHFDEMLDMHWRSALREGSRVNLMFMDIDDFKAFNDHYGHQAGDDCLLQVAQALGSQALRASDFIARYGGEEFVALFPGTNPEGLEIIAQRLIEAVDDIHIPHARARAADYVTLSVGIASMQPGSNNGPADLIKLADDALYQAKGRGRHSYVFATAPTEIKGKTGQAL